MPEYIKAHGIIYANELKSIHKSRNPMQPIFEAFTNAWEAIFERFTAEYLQNGQITISFHYTLGVFNEKEYKSYTLNKIEIRDNGLGINEKSFERIVNLRDNSKSALNKGTGRVQFLHFFDETIFESVYEKTNREHERIVLVLSKKDTFLRENAILRKDSAGPTSSSEYGTLVTFINPIDEKNDGAFFNRMTSPDIKNELIIHFLSKFCESKEHLPKIIIERYENDNKLEPVYIGKEDIPNPDKTESLDVHYSKLENRKVVDSLNCEHFTLLSFIQSQEQLKKNCIYFVSNGAIAQEVSIDSLQADDSIDGNRYMFLLRGNYFDSIEDDLRGNLHLVKESEFKKQGELFPEECILVEKIKLYEDSISSVLAFGLDKEFDISHPLQLFHNFELKLPLLFKTDCIDKRDLYLRFVNRETSKAFSFELNKPFESFAKIRLFNENPITSVCSYNTLPLPYLYNKLYN